MKDHVTSLSIEPLGKRHSRSAFDCGNPGLNEYLANHARQNDTNNLARTFVAVDEHDVVLGFYCLSAASVDFENLPTDMTKRLPRYPVPAALIGRLACDQSVQGQGLGAHLLISALQHILLASEELGIKVALVDAIDENAKRFYQHFGFLPLRGHEMKLFLPIETIAQLF
ncbi:MAG: GNAT family N-acetyltransferase [Gammaproteobacteria bacterium]|nr:GNAT family N-acetyltransferase [Gammaproteobacteria bacterium]